MGGFWEALSGYAVQWIAPVLEGRLIVISTITAADEQQKHQVTAEAKLFVYDVSARKIVREIVPISKARTTGLISELASGQMMGLTASGSGSGQPGNGVLYVVDVGSGAVLFRKDLPWPVSVDNYWPHWVDPSYEYLSLTRGPDDFFWTYLKDVLVRIEPESLRITVVGKVDPVGAPVFVGRDVYFSGSERLRRIRNIAAHRSPRP
jgi:hypothetical protein